MKLDKHATLVTRLYKGTMDGQVEWLQSARPHAYQVSFSNYSVILFTKDADYIIQVTNSDGDVVESFSDVQLDAGGAANPPVDNWYKTMIDLYGMARRVAQGADKALDDILKELPE